MLDDRTDRTILEEVMRPEAMNEYVVISRRQEINVWNQDGEVGISVEQSRGDRSTVILNPAQVERLISLLQKASQLALEKTD